MRRICSLLRGVVLVMACGCGSTPLAPTTARPTASDTSTSPATALSVSGPTTVPLAGSGQYKATATLANGAMIFNAAAEWKTDNATVAVIDANGLLTARQSGPVTITAIYRGFATTTVIAVTAENANQAHLREILALMEARSVKRTAIEWQDFGQQVTAATTNGPEVRDAYPGIRRALELLNDRDSFYLSADKQQRIESPGEGCPVGAGTPLIPSVPPTIGYVRVPAFNGEAEAELTQFAESLQDAIRRADRPDLTGWIVDLRGNVGGNMWPMIAGVGPVLGDGILGYIVYPDRQYEREYRNGAAQSLGEIFARVRQPYTLLYPNPRVAVLTDGGVISAGEAVAVYFRGRPGARSFGTPTCGHHHLFTFFPLSDGAYLALVEAEHADRTGRHYSGPISPDELVDPNQGVSRAIAWLTGGN